VHRVLLEKVFPGEAVVTTTDEWATTPELNSQAADRQPL
jgi:hypothetical protein